MEIHCFHQEIYPFLTNEFLHIFKNFQIFFLVFYIMTKKNLLFQLQIHDFLLDFQIAITFLASERQSQVLEEFR